MSSNALNRSVVAGWSLPRATMPKNAEQGAPATETQTTIKRRANGQPIQKRRKLVATQTVDDSLPTNMSLEKLGGLDDVIDQLTDMLLIPLTMPDLYNKPNAPSSRGILISGPPGCGKTALVNAFAASIGTKLIYASAPSLIGGVTGETEKSVRDIFDKAKKNAPCILFIDEIDVIAPRKGGSHRGMENRTVAQLATCMDDIKRSRTDNKVVVVIAATCRPDVLDPSLRRTGRFSREINMRVPNEAARERIIRAIVGENTVSEDVDYALLARRTPGFVGSDLDEWFSLACESATRRLSKTVKDRVMTMQLETDEATSDGNMPTVSDMSKAGILRQTAAYLKGSGSEFVVNADDLSLQITMFDFLTSLPRVQPSALREGFTTIPSTTFESIGALKNHIKELDSSIIYPILEPTAWSDMGVEPPSGVLLWGPPGCGKTLLAKATANASHANFISVKGPELLNKYVGESERAVRQVFMRARSSVPVIIFFDEVDALAPSRDSSLSEASSRVVNTLLSELDGVGESREGIYIIAATNRPEMIDAALRRPGRLDTMLYVGLPDADGRVDILKTLCKRVKDFTWTTEMTEFAKNCEGFSGADMEMLIKRAAQIAMDGRRHERLASSTNTTSVTTDMIVFPKEKMYCSLSIEDFIRAKAEVRRSVSEEEMKRYERLARGF